MLPRKLRVLRAKDLRKPKARERAYPGHQPDNRKPKKHRLRQSTTSQIPLGRAKKLLGRAGAAQLEGKGADRRFKAAKPPESFVFEGQRASRGGVTKGAFAKRGGKSQTRSSRRGSEFKRQEKAKR